MNVDDVVEYVPRRAGTAHSPLAFGSVREWESIGVLDSSLRRKSDGIRSIGCKSPS